MDNIYKIKSNTNKYIELNTTLSPFSELWLAVKIPYPNLPSIYISSISVPCMEKNINNIRDVIQKTSMALARHAKPSLAKETITRRWRLGRLAFYFHSSVGIVGIASEPYLIQIPGSQYVSTFYATYFSKKKLSKLSLLNLS